MSNHSFDKFTSVPSAPLQSMCSAVAGNSTNVRNIKQLYSHSKGSELMNDFTLRNEMQNFVKCQTIIDKTLYGNM